MLSVFFSLGPLWERSLFWSNSNFSLVNGILFSGPFKNFYGKKAGTKSATASP